MKEIKFIFSILIKNKLKDYIFFTIIGFSIIFCFLLLFSNFLFIGEKNKVFIDLGIAGINFILLISSIYFSSECFPEIKKNKFINWLLSLPIKKYHIFMGSFLYISTLLFIIALFYNGLYFLFFVFFKVNFSKKFLVYFSLNFLKFLILSVIGLIITIKYNTYTGMLSLFCIYFIGCYTFNFLQYLIKKGFYKVISIGKVIYYIFPDFQIPDLTANITHLRAIDLSILLQAIIYYFSYLIIFLLIGAVLFEKNEL